MTRQSVSDARQKSSMRSGAVRPAAIDPAVGVLAVVNHSIEQANAAVLLPRDQSVAVMLDLIRELPRRVFRLARAAHGVTSRNAYTLSRPPSAPCWLRHFVALDPVFIAKVARPPAWKFTIRLDFHAPAQARRHFLWSGPSALGVRAHFMSRRGGARSG
jgi:hypothetical protein